MFDVNPTADGRVPRNLLITSLNNPPPLHTQKIFSLMPLEVYTYIHIHTCAGWVSISGGGRGSLSGEEIIKI